MSDLFISYSRANRAFVEKLDRALQERGRNTWIDWADIHPSAEWLKEILRAIESAATFVTVLSEQFAQSKVCIDELEHALKCNKRIVPILIDNVDERALPDPVRSRQWIFCKQPDDFDAALSALISAIDTDLDWVQTHTRLLTRAIEWEKNNKDYSYALRGRDLKKAEACLTAQEKDPQLTSLQIDYIISSRRDSTRRSTFAIGALALAVVAVTVFGLLFWQKRQEQALTLASNFREAGILQLAANNPLAAEDLFAHALAINPTANTRDRLEQARAKSPRLVWSSREFPSARTITISSDGRLFALRVAGDVDIFDSQTRKRIGVIPVEGDIRVGAFDIKNEIVALVHDKVIQVWKIDSKSQKPFGIFEASDQPTSLSFSSDGKLLIAGLLNGDIFVWDISVTTQSPFRQLHGHTDRVTSTAITKDGHVLVSGSWDETVKIWDLTGSKEPTTLVGHDDSILSVAMSPDEDIIASAGWDTTILLWDIKTGKQLGALAGHQGSILSLAFSPDGRWLASASEDKSIRLWDVQKRQHFLTLPGHEGDVNAVAFLTANGLSEVVTGDAMGVVRLWNIGDLGQREELQTLKGHTAAITMVDFSPVKPLLISASVDQTIRAWDIETRKTVWVCPRQNNGVSAIQFSPDGHHFASATREAFISVWDIDTGAFEKLINYEDSAAIRYIAYSGDGSLLAAGSDDGRITIFNVSDKKILSSFAAHSQKVQGIVFSPDGTLLASAGDDVGGLKLWRTKDWTLLRALAGHRSGVYQISFSPDGRFLLSTSDDKTARLWEINSGQQVLNIRHDSPVWTGDFSPDGNFIATGSEDSTIHIWKLAHQGGEPKLYDFAVLRIFDGPVWDLELKQSAKGLLLAAGGQDRSIRILNLSLFEKFSTRPDEIEREAEERGGLTVQLNGNEPEIVPTQYNRFEPVTNAPTVRIQDYGTIGSQRDN
ncbi:MAG: hypothetical protein C5B47_03990 [Verrucomicrobia bacterium]|nr:MAG: hypothetical protein C5B47_03990 [Verrucomicrobiota bacterium]